VVQSLFAGLLDWLRSAYLNRSVRLLKVRAAVYYLNGVKRVHGILIHTCLVIFVITLITAGLVMIPLVMMLFAPWEAGTKLLVGLIIGLVYILAAAIALLVLLSEKRWMRLTGATDILHKLAD